MISLPCFLRASATKPKELRQGPLTGLHICWRCSFQQQPGQLDAVRASTMRPEVRGLTPGMRRKQLSCLHSTDNESLSQQEEQKPPTPAHLYSSLCTDNLRCTCLAGIIQSSLASVTTETFGNLLPNGFPFLGTLAERVGPKCSP